ELPRPLTAPACRTGLEPTRPTSPSRSRRRIGLPAVPAALPSDEMSDPMHVPEPPAEPSPESPDVHRGGSRGGNRASAPLLAAVLVVVLGGGGLFVAGVARGARTASQPGTPAGEAELFQPFWDAYTAITEHYAGEPVTHRQVVSGAI